MTMILRPLPATRSPVAGVGRERGGRSPTLTALALMALLGAAGTLAACNTAAGLGDDLSAAGSAISNSADQNKGY